VYNGDITKFLWGDLGALPPQLFSRGGDRRHEVGAYGSVLLELVRNRNVTDWGHYISCFVMM